MRVRARDDEARSVILFLEKEREREMGEEGALGRKEIDAVCTYLAFIFSTCRGRDVDSSCLVHSRITSVPSPTPQASRHVSTSTASWDSTGHGNTTRQYFRRRCELCTRMVRFSRSVQRCRASRNPDRSPQRAQLKGWTFHSRLAEWAARAATMPCGRARRQKPHQMMTAAGAKPHAASSAPLLACSNSILPRRRRLRVRRRTRSCIRRKENSAHRLLVRAAAETPPIIDFSDLSLLQGYLWMNFITQSVYSQSNDQARTSGETC